MYIPRSFAIEDLARLRELMERFSFATLVTVEDGLPIATHLPFLFRPADQGYGTLIAHMARANSQWRTFAANREALVIFQGHHAYISPAWYTTQPSVPTWNYMVIHAYGVPRIIDDDEQVEAILRSTVERYEGVFGYSWRMELPEEFLQRQLKAIVAFEIPLSRIEGKFKLSQNRSEEDRRGVIAGLEQSPDPVNRELAQLMRELVLETASAQHGPGSR